MDLDDITPVVLTYNEEANIRRVLDRLAWAKTIIVVDSFSSDDTLELVDGYANVRRYQRPFDNFDRQWTYAVTETAIATEWILALDADFILSDAFVRSLEALALDADVHGYETRFRFCIHGRPLRRSLYPPRIVLARRNSLVFSQDGHAHRVAVRGGTRPLPEPLDLDDRKPLTRWVANQQKYVQLELVKLRSTSRGQIEFADRVRVTRFLGPLVVLFYCLFVKRMIFEGLPGWYYTYQRVGFEILLSLYLIEDRFAEVDETARREGVERERR
jgi:glycosyltransferase involved in cell wall biosynthesis